MTLLVAGCYGDISYLFFFFHSMTIEIVALFFSPARECKQVCEAR